MCDVCLDGALKTSRALSKTENRKFAIGSVPVVADGSKSKPFVFSRLPDRGIVSPLRIDF